jgi:hypothetical protein
MENEEFIKITLHNVLADRNGREFVRVLLSECGVDLTSGMSYRTEKTAHELGLDLLHKIMYNEIEQLKTIISEQKALEVNNGRGNGYAGD